jgi:hypothetical protein
MKQLAATTAMATPLEWTFEYCTSFPPPIRCAAR